MTPFALPHGLHGSGPHKVIAVHGWFADRSAFDALLPDLDQDAFQYALVDLRGYGEAKGAAGAYTTQEAAADVLALADRLGWDRFSLIGHSMGGSVIQRVVAAAPHRVRRLAGVSPVPASGLPMPPEQWELFTSAEHDPDSRRAILDITTGGTPPCGMAGPDGAAVPGVQRPEGVPGLAGLMGEGGVPHRDRGLLGPGAGGDRRAGPGPERRPGAADVDAMAHRRQARRTALGGPLLHGRDAAGTDPDGGGLPARGRRRAGRRR